MAAENPVPSYIIGAMFPDWMDGLSPRARRCLLAGGYTTRMDVVVATAMDLLTVRGLGMKTLRELNAWRRPRTKDECARVAAWLQTKQASLLLTRRGSELCRAVLLADAGNGDANQLRFRVLETLYPTIKLRAHLSRAASQRGSDEETLAE